MVPILQKVMINIKIVMNYINRYIFV